MLMHDDTDTRPPQAPGHKSYFSPYQRPAGLRHTDVGRETGTTALPAAGTQQPEQTFGPASTVPLPGTAAVPKQSRLQKLLPAFTYSHGQLSRKRLFILLAVCVVILLGAGTGAYALVRRHKPAAPPPAPVAQAPVAPPAPTTVASTLTGLQVKPAVNKRPVTAVMIENSLDARPQSGLNSAGVVFEAVAEGGITRFEALYQDTTADYIGPVRSARYYYIEWLLGFDAAYAHVGGSPEALQDIASWHVKDLNQFYNAGAYERITSRFAPHNVYTSTAQLNALEQAKGFTTSTYTGFPRNTASTPSPHPTVTSINMTFSGADYNTHYDYDAKAHNYKRSEGGEPHYSLQKNGSKVRIAPRVLVALVMQHGTEPDGYHSTYNTIGHGKMYVFQGGTVATGIWHKSSRTSQFTFTKADGSPLNLDPGQTWVSVLGNSSDVSYK